MSVGDLDSAEVKSSTHTEKNDSVTLSEPAKKRLQQELDAEVLLSGNTHVKKKRKKNRGAEHEGGKDLAKDRADKKSKKEQKKREKAALVVQAANENPVSVLPQKRDSMDSDANVDSVVEEVPDTEQKKRKKKSKKTDSDSPMPVTTSEAQYLPTPAEINNFLKEHSITIHTRDGFSLTPCISFDQLEIHEKLKASFAGFKCPTPIQACTWPPAMSGKDVVGIAETGSGKTLAFGIPAMMRLIGSKSSKKITTLVVAPTRELALQTHETLSIIGEPFGIASVAVFGGVPKEPQITMLANSGMKKGMTTRIIVGTPGRILDLANDKACDLSSINYLVLDEADRMLDKGFENDIRKIISMTKQGTERQTMMFSATWPEAVRRLASTFQQDPVRVTVGSDDLTANNRVEQAVDILDNSREKDSKLLGELKKSERKNGKDARILIFALYKKEASRVEQYLRNKGFSVGALHGDLNQNARMKALEAFKMAQTPVLVATDVAARGLDIPDVNTVINYTFPLTIEDYIHRIGRTGRGGKSGRSITFFTGEAHEKALAGEFARVLRESGFECEELRKRFPMTIKKKTHGAYGAFFRDDVQELKAPSRIVFS